MKYPATIVPLALPHGSCQDGCPYCPPPGTPPLLEPPLPDELSALVDRCIEAQFGAEGQEKPIELGLYGGDLWSLPRIPRTALLDAAEREVRRGRVRSIRITLSPSSVLKAPLAEFRSRGVGTVEVPLHSLEREVRQELGLEPTAPLQVLDAIGRLHRARLRSVAHLTPGLPSSSHQSAVRTAEAVASVSPGGARVLPALALEGTRLAAFLERGWKPMRLDEAVVTCRDVVLALRARGVPVIRLGLQPGFDLAESPEVLDGPHDPSLRGQVESEAIRQHVIAALTSVFALGTRAFTVVVHPREEHGVRGHENQLLHDLIQQFRLRELRILGLDEQPPGTVRAFAGLLKPEDVPPLPSGSARKVS